MAVLRELERIDNLSKKTLNGNSLLYADAVQFGDSMSGESDDENVMSSQEEIKNIENVITLTRASIDALSARFADFQNPPAVYLKEYDELTSKLREMEEIKRRLIEEISSGEPSAKTSHR